MAKPTAQQCHALTTYFVNEYEAAYGHKPTVNRNKARWGFESILMDFSPVEARQLIDYYIKHYAKPSLEWFLFNYDKVVDAKNDHEKEETLRAARRRETEKRLEEWRQRWKK